MNEMEKWDPEEYESRRAAIRARKRRKSEQELYIRIILILFGFTALAITGGALFRLWKGRKAEPVVQEVPVPGKVVQEPPDYRTELLSVNEYSRPGTPLEEVTGIVIHYTANPGTTAMQNRDYFEGLGTSGETYASSHYIIGMEGELVQCIPCDEIAYASNERNADTIAIECCIPDESGKFTDATYQTLLHLAAWLMGKYGIEIDDVIRHYDVTGKECPKYYVDYPLEWEKMKRDILEYIDTYGE